MKWNHLLLMKWIFAAIMTRRIFIQNSFPDTGKAHCPLFIPKEFLKKKTTHINGTHTHTQILYIEQSGRFRFIHRYTKLVQMDCISVYTTVHCLPPHTFGAHTMLGSVVLLYVNDLFFKIVQYYVIILLKRSVFVQNHHVSDKMFYARVIIRSLF